MLRQLIFRGCLAWSEFRHHWRQSFSELNDSAGLPLSVGRLEDRVLFSATPLPAADLQQAASETSASTADSSTDSGEGSSM